MASTYVNDLRLNEMATGDGSGTWGTTTNTNLELIAEALGYGTEGITTNADTHTTTIADGATDPGRAMYLEYTGTLDSACTITIAPNTISRMQFIENGTSGSQNIIISQGSGANITIPPGDTKAVYLDGAGSGAAVVDAFASLNVVDLKVQDDLTVTDDVIIGGDIDLEGSIDVNGTANLDVVDIDGAVDMASTLQVDGVATFTGRDIHSGGITIANAGQIGSVGDTDAIAIASDGVVTLTQKLVGTELDISGNVDIDGTTNLDNTDIDGTLDVSGQVTFADGSAGAPSISNTGDVNAGLFFSAADVMSFSAGGTAQFTMADGSISPVTDNDIDLGTASLKYKSFFAGLVDSENFKINGGQGDDGQVLTSTGSGVAWEAASGGATDINGLSDAKTFGTSSIMLGDATTGTIDAANYNTGLGIDVFAALTSGDNNSVLGFSAGNDLTTGEQNTFIGTNAGQQITTGDKNIALGQSALLVATTGDKNTMLGHRAGAAITTVGENTFVGNEAGESTTTGGINTFVGHQAGEANTTGSSNVFVGSNAGDANTTAADNVAVGVNALGANTTGHSNTAVGKKALLVSTTGSYNTAVGWEAGVGITSGQSNTLMGQATGAGITDGESNAFFGMQAGYATTTGDSNTFLGFRAGDAITTGSNNTAIGRDALGAATTSSSQVAIGFEALKVQNSNAHNTAVGVQAGVAITSGASNDLFGFNAGDSITTGDTNICVGGFSMDSGAAQTGSANTHVGHDGMKVCTSGTGNTSMGLDATKALTTGNSNTCIGRGAGTAITTGSSNCSIGISSMASTNTGSGNTCMGNVAGANITSGSNNLCLGFEAGNAGSPSGDLGTNSNRIVLGDDAITNALIRVDWTVTSDKRDKTDIEPLKMGLNFVNKLEPVTYKWDMRSSYSKDLSITPDGTHKKQKVFGGLLAQDVEKLEREYGYKVEDETSIITDKNTNGSYGIAYSKFIPVLINAVQELSTQVDELKSELLALKGE